MQRPVKQNKFWQRFGLAVIFLIFLGQTVVLYPQEHLRDRFTTSKKIRYNISFNGIPSGHIDWEYLGRDSINSREVDVLLIKSDTKILRLLNLVSSEKIYLDAKDSLPVKVERDLKLFGRAEIIKEYYDQEQGKVTIIKKTEAEEATQEVYEQDTPIHNILELLYFFPDEVDLKEKQGEWMEFNLPNQKVQIRYNSIRQVAIDGEREEAYFLEGKGARRFNLWLSQENRLPLRLDFLFLLGRVTIRKQRSQPKEAKL